MQAAKQAGKKLGRPKGGKIKGEDKVLYLYLHDSKQVGEDLSNDGILRCSWRKQLTYQDISNKVGVSKGTVQKIINKYKKEDE